MSLSPVCVMHFCYVPVLKYTSHISMFWYNYCCWIQRRGRVVWCSPWSRPSLPVCNAVSSCNHPLCSDDGPTTDVLLPSFQRHLICKKPKWEQVNVLGPLLPPQTWRLNIFCKTDPNILQILEIMDCEGVKPIQWQLRKKSSVGTRRFPAPVWL